MTKVFVRAIGISKSGALLVDVVHLSHYHSIKIFVDSATATEKKVKDALAEEVEWLEKSVPLYNLLLPWVGHEIELPELRPKVESPDRVGPEKEEAHDEPA